MYCYISVYTDRQKVVCMLYLRLRVYVQTHVPVNTYVEIYGIPS